MTERRMAFGSINCLEDILKNPSLERVFLVTGKGSYQSSGAKSYLSTLTANKTISRFSDFDVNPTLEDLCKGVEQFNEFKPNIIIAIGGGSALDMGKLINIISANPHASVKQMITTRGLIEKKGLNMVAVPTTAGTGSEVTQFAVVYIADKKYSLDHKFLLPDYYIVDPALTLNLPPSILASSAFDALSQAIESFWSVGSTNESKDYSRESIKLILKSMEKAVNQKHLPSIESLCYGANLAGKAINITRTTAPHALSYPLTKRHGIPHGHAVALNLGKFFVINSSFKNNDVIDERGEDYLKAIMHELFTLFGCCNEFECADKWYKMMQEVSLETDLKKLGIIKDIDIQEIVEGVNLERLKNNPVSLSKEILYDLFKK